MLLLHFAFNLIVNAYMFIVFITVISSWLVHFNVINPNQQFVAMILRMCYQLTEPALRHIRNILPNMGGLDLSPIVLLLGLQIFQFAINTYVFYPAINAGIR